MTKKKNRSFKVIILSVLLIFLLIGSVVGYFYLDAGLNQTILNSKNRLFKVNKGETLNSLCQRMLADELVSDCLPIKLHAKVFDTYTGIKSGTYEMNKKMVFSHFLLNLVEGNEKQFPFTIVEGDNIYQVLAKLNNAKLLENDLAGLPLPETSKKLGLNYKSPEGWLYPETYYYSANTSASELLSRAVKKQITVLNKAWGEKADNLAIHDVYQALILASIIEKESSVAGERDIISSVFHNRLKKRMRLQTDPTVIYGIWHEYDGDIKRKHLNQMTPYNTYRIKGLTPTPISNPSLASIVAVLHPAQTNYLYFVASGNGDHIFSPSLEEHNRAVRNYLKKQRIKSLQNNDG